MSLRVIERQKEETTTNTVRALIPRFAVAALVCLAISLCILPAAAGAVAVTIVPAAQSVTAGDAVRVEVVVEHVPGLAAYQFTLQFVPEAMRVAQVTEGEFLKAHGTTLGAGLEKIDNAAGRVSCFYSLTARGASVTGSGVLTTVYFQSASTASGTYELLLTDVLLGDGTGTPIPVESISNGTCTLTRAEQPASTASPMPTPAPDSNGGTEPEPGAPDQNGSEPASTPAAPSPAAVPGTPPAATAVPTTTPAASAWPTTTPAASAMPPTTPTTSAAPTPTIPGFTAAGLSGCLLVLVTYMLRQQR